MNLWTESVILPQCEILPYFLFAFVFFVSDMTMNIWYLGFGGWDPLKDGFAVKVPLENHPIFF